MIQSHANFTEAGERKDPKNPKLSIPSTSLPQGSGSIRSIQEKHEVRQADGTMNFSLPLPISPGRNGFNPTLQLQYNSNNGNGIFGLGWNLNISSISRKTGNRLPTYTDDNDGDVFVINNAEELIPVLEGNTGKARISFQTDENIEFEVSNYQPRIEGSFSRIQKWTHVHTRETHWRVTTRDNVISYYGKSKESVISDPADERRIYSWLICQTHDDKGNLCLYEYKTENSDNVSAKVSEKNRSASFAQKYPKRIFYGNREAYYKGGTLPNNESFLFRIVFDYGEHQLADNPGANVSEEELEWESRHDIFSSYKCGFDLRTYRRCQNILFFHCFDSPVDLPINPCLVRSLSFGFHEEHDNLESINNGLSMLTSIIQTSYEWNLESGSYSSQSLPAMEFEYQLPGKEPLIGSIDSAEMTHSPQGLNDMHYQWIDLYSEGISGILFQDQNAWYFKYNLGNGKFSNAQLAVNAPAVSNNNEKDWQLLELEANGVTYLCNYSSETPGFFKLDWDKEWHPFKTFDKTTVNSHSNNLTALTDLDGDGRPDMLAFNDNLVNWYKNEGELGFQVGGKLNFDPEPDGNTPILSPSSSERMFLADMNGDGLSDLVRIRNGEVCYWANMGYGRFGPCVSMDDSPYFDFPDQFDLNLIRLADINGSGLTDIIYLGSDKISVWLNQSGNAWKPCAQLSTDFCQLNDSINVSVCDLMGIGVSYIVLSSPLPSEKSFPIKYIDFHKGKKPYLLSKYKNNYGKEVRLEYKSSVQYFLEDKVDGLGWFTKLPFPVHVVSQIEVTDSVSQLRFVSSYKYHHGHFDPVEKEFCGFGRVDQVDTETFQEFSKSKSANNTTEELHQFPVLTKTWYHTGFVQPGLQEELIPVYKHEFFKSENFVERVLESIHINTGDVAPLHEVDGSLVKEAFRSCKSTMMRQEIYMLDDSEKATVPVTVQEQVVETNLVQPAAFNKPAVFYSRICENITYKYERSPDDPVITHNLILKADRYGNTEQKISISYGRKIIDPQLPDSISKVQSTTHVLFEETNYTNDIITDNSYLLRKTAEVRRFELKNIVPENSYFAKADFSAIPDIVTNWQNVASLDQEMVNLTSHERILFSSEKLDSPLPLYKIERNALIFRTFTLVFNDEMLNEICNGKVKEADIRAGGFINSKSLQGEGLFPQTDHEDFWWIPSGFVSYAPDFQESFFLPELYTDPFGNSDKALYEKKYQLYIETVEDAAKNKKSVLRFNYRVLSPDLVSDINNNITEFCFDRLGMVSGYAVKGKDEELNDLIDFAPALTKAEINEFFTDPHGLGPALLKNASSRFIYDHSSIPVVAATITREFHSSDERNINEPVLHFSFAYSNGLGHTIMTKSNVDAGQAFFVDENGHKASRDTNQRWLASGHIKLNNKGNPVAVYDPYFSTTHKYEDDPVLIYSGVSSFVYYDALSRNIRTENPNGTFRVTEHGNWFERVSDEMDTIESSIWLSDRLTGKLSANALESSTAKKVQIHANTPSSSFKDALGRTFFFENQNVVIDEVTGSRSVEKVTAFYKLSFSGNIEEIHDSLGNVVVSCKYDLVGRKLYQKTMDTGETWYMLNQAGVPQSSWNSQGTTYRYSYDSLSRPLKVYSENNGIKKNIISIEYGSNTAADIANNLCGQAIFQADSSGIKRNRRFDISGNLLISELQLAINYKSEIDWEDSVGSLVEEKIFSTASEYSATGKVQKITLPNNKTIHFSYNASSFLKALSVDMGNGQESLQVIENIQYDERSRRKQILLGNGIQTISDFDPLTGSLIRQVSRMENNPGNIQDINITYDPIGNITFIDDTAQQDIFFRNSVVRPLSEYSYDSLYRLIHASGREHAGQQVSQIAEWTDNFRTSQPHPHDGNAMRNYSQKYSYDKNGNIVELKHIAAGGNYSKKFIYENGSNRLLETTIGSESITYSYNDAGCLNSISHLGKISWTNQADVASIDLPGGGKSYYVYNADRQRIRKIIELPGGKKKETIYLGSLEVYREFDGGTSELEIESMHIMDGVSRVAIIETKTLDLASSSNLNLPRTKYLLLNQINSTSVELDEQGNVISYEEYHPYGTSSFQSVGPSQFSLRKKYRFTGKERDDETGFSYHGTRYYVPWICRWLSPDPSGISDGLNLYQYAHNNPVSKIDPTGNAAVTVKPGNSKTEDSFQPVVLKIAPSGKSPPKKEVVEEKKEEAAVEPTPAISEDDSFPLPDMDIKQQEEHPVSSLKSVTKTGLYDEVILGELYQGPSTTAGTLIGIGLSLVPFVDTTMDVRDIIGAKEKYDKSQSSETSFNLGINALGIVPLVGSLITGVKKAVRIRRGIKSTTNVVDATVDISQGFARLDAFKQTIKDTADPAQLEEMNKSTFSRLVVGGNESFGNAVSLMGRSREQSEMIRKMVKEMYGKSTMSATMQHAEADALINAYNKGLKADKAVMFVDRNLCGYCYTSLKNVLPLTGIKELTVYAREGDYIYEYVLKNQQ